MSWLADRLIQPCREEFSQAGWETRGYWDAGDTAALPCVGNPSPCSAASHGSPFVPGCPWAARSCSSFITLVWVEGHRRAWGDVLAFGGVWTLTGLWSPRGFPLPLGSAGLLGSWMWDAWHQPWSCVVFAGARCCRLSHSLRWDGKDGAAVRVLLLVQRASHGDFSALGKSLPAFLHLARRFCSQGLGG